MKQIISKINFPPNDGERGYVFAAYTTSIEPEKAIEFLKTEGDFLSLNEECQIGGNCERKTTLTILNGEVVIKLHYHFDYGHSWDIDVGKADAKSILEQVENLLEYAEKSAESKGGR